MPEFPRHPLLTPSRRSLGAALLIGFAALLLALTACMKPVDAPPYSILFFNPFSTVLDAQAQQVIDRVVADAQASPRRVIVVEGFADRAITTPAQNKTLADQRAQAVADGLVAHGVDRTRVTFRPRGDARADPGIESRRVDISFAP